MRECGVCLICETDRPRLRAGVPGDRPSPLRGPDFRFLQGRMERINILDLELRCRRGSRWD